MTEGFQKTSTHIPGQSGQSLLEVIIAVGIIITGVVGTLVLILYTVFTSEASKAQILGVNLAREGVEIIRNIRDSNWLKIDSEITGVTWNAGLAQDPLIEENDYTAIAHFAAATGTWSLDFTVDALSDSRSALWLQADGLYNQFAGAPSGQQTQYQRLLTLNPICRDQNNANEEVQESGEDCDNLDEIGTTDFSQVGVEVHSDVRWSTRGREHEIRSIEKLYDWKV